MATTILSAGRLRERLDYDPDTGLFRWRFGRRGARPPGRVAGCNTRGYIAIRVDGVLYLAHRLAWLHVYGAWPATTSPRGGLDHIDRNKANNRITNLREASKCLNSQNIARARADSGTGVLGVSWHPQRRKYVAHLSVNGRYVLTKHFGTLEGARAAYLEAKMKHAPGFHHAGITSQAE